MSPQSERATSSLTALKWDDFPNQGECTDSSYKNCHHINAKIEYLFYPLVLFLQQVENNNILAYTNMHIVIYTTTWFPVK